MKKAKVSLILVMLLVFVAGCAWLQQTFGIKSYEQMTPQEKVLFLYKTYNKQYDDYKATVAKGNLTEETKKILRVKKEIFKEVYPAIQLLDLNLIEGKPIDAVLEAKVLALLERLGAIIK